jgi:uncharacterized protein (TIGR00369 family)
MDGRSNDQKLFSVINEVFTEKIPFNKFLGVRIEWLGYERVTVSFQMREELMGNYRREMLHGGVISSVIDATGGLCAAMGVQQTMSRRTLEARLERLGKVSTIDLRVDFLRPGVGKGFIAKAHNLRTGNKIAVARVELSNDQNDLIAVGTGSYLVA